MSWPTALRRGGSAESAVNAPTTKPIWTALVNSPTSLPESPHAAASSGATALAENQRLIEGRSAVATRLSARQRVSCTMARESDTA